MANQALKDLLSRDLEIPESVDNKIEETLLRIKTDELKCKSYKKPILKKPASLAAAVAIVLLMFSTIALAASEELRDFIGGFFVVRVEQEDAHFMNIDDGLVISTDPDHGLDRVEIFLSFEEFQRSATFTVREPSFLPDDLTFMEASILPNEDGTSSDTVIITYRCAQSYNMLWLIQKYIGVDANLELEVVDRIELDDFRSVTTFDAVMIGDIEALLSITTVDGVQDDHISLSWSYDDGFAYMVSSIGFDVDTLIAIAKSI